MLMRLMSKGGYLIIPKGTKFTGLGKLGLKLSAYWMKWHNRWRERGWGGGGWGVVVWGADCPPKLLTGKFLLNYQEKRGQEKRKIGKKEGKLKREGEKLNWKWKEEKLQNEEMTFFFLLLFCFSLLKIHWNLFWVNQNGNFLPGKSISCREKIRKNDFAPLEKFSCYAPDWMIMI